MRPRRVLITGVSSPLGGQLARVLADDPAIERIIGVDTAAPRADLGRTEFVRADIRNPLIAKVVGSAQVDSVAHLSLLPAPLAAGGRALMKEVNVIGSMQLLGACQKAASVRKLVVKSTAAIYGSSPRDPAMFSESMEPRELPRGGYAKDAVEVEGYVRGFGRRRPDVTVTLLRFGTVIGPQTTSPLTRYLSLPVVPTPLGYDPRLQLLHEQDALGVLLAALYGDTGGTFNVAGEGVVLLSQAARRAGRVTVPVAPQAVALGGGLLRRLRLLDYSPEQVRLLEFGRAMDTSRLATGLGYSCRYTTAEALDDYVSARLTRKLVDPEVLRDTENSLMNFVRRHRTVQAHA